MPDRYGMNRQGLTPQEEGPRDEDRTGVLPFGQRRPMGRMAVGGSVVDGYEYAKGGPVKRKKKKKQRDYDREDESIAMRKKKKRTKKQLKASKDESYGKWGKRGKDWKKKGKA